MTALEHPLPARAGAGSRTWLVWAAAFVLFSALALSGVIPRGPIGSWETPLWADVVLAPFSGAATLIAAALVLVARERGLIDRRLSAIAVRVVIALLVATAVEVVIKASFPGSAGPLGAVAVGPIEFGFYPSGHTLRATIISASFAALTPIGRRIGPLFVVVPLAVGTMLVSAGGHFPVDIAGGLLLGLAAAGWALRPRAEGS